MTQGWLRTTCGSVLPGEDWMGDVATADDAILDWAEAPVLDVGCGPARHATELAARGIPALGIDISGPALEVARLRGAAVLERCVFDRVPAAGRWATALLLDGNIGIGGEPESLLRRVHGLLRPGGSILVDVAGSAIADPDADPDADPARDAAASAALDGSRTARVEIGAEAGPWFDWHVVHTGDLDDIARRADLSIGNRWDRDGRHFAVLT